MIEGENVCDTGVCTCRAGNEVCFSLETASDYVKDEKACFFGFSCTVIGYEWPPSSTHLVCITVFSESSSSSGFFH